MIYAYAVVAVALVLRYMQIDGRTSPDSEYYLGMVVSRSVPKPYCHRPLVPLAAKAIVKATGWSPHHVMRVLVVAGVVTAVVAAMAWAQSMGLSALAVATVGIVIVATDSLVGSWIMFPWLVDSWSVAFALLALASPYWWLSALLLVLAAVSKEAAFVVAAAFMVALEPGMWWVAVPGVAALGLIRLLVTPAPPNQEWLKNPVRQAFQRKRRLWLSWQKNLSHLKATPYLVAWLIPGTTWAAPLAVVWAIAWLQCHVAMDHARLLALAVPFTIPVLASLIDPQWLVMWALISWFWPFEAAEFA